MGYVRPPNTEGDLERPCGELAKERGYGGKAQILDGYVSSTMLTSGNVYNYLVID